MVKAVRDNRVDAERTAKHEIPGTNDQSWKVRGKPSTKGMPGGNGAAGGDGGAPSSFGRSHILATEGKIRVTPYKVEVLLSFGLRTDGFGVAGDGVAGK